MRHRLTSTGATALLLSAVLWLGVPVGFGQTDRVGQFIKQLEHPDSMARMNAADGLGDINGPRAVEALIEALKDVEPDVRSSAAKALGELKDLRAVEPLGTALRDRGRFEARRCTE